MTIPVVYIAGPINAETAWLREANIRRAETAALDVWKSGGVALCVHAMTRYYCEQDMPYEAWIAGDLELLSRCDALLTVEGWEDSPGARREVEAAHAQGMPVLHSPWALRVFLSRDELNEEKEDE